MIAKRCSLIFLIVFIVSVMFTGCGGPPSDDDLNALLVARISTFDKAMSIEDFRLETTKKINDDLYVCKVSAKAVFSRHDYFDFSGFDVLPTDTYRTGREYGLSAYLRVRKDDGEWLLDEVSRKSAD